MAPYITEYLDIVNPDGTRTGKTISRHHAHATGALHRTVHVWVCDDQGNLLLQKRARTKRSYPDLWDTSCAGHISAGQESLQAAVREMVEELGIEISETELKRIGTLPQSLVQKDKGRIDNELTDIYLLLKNIPLEKIVCDPAEVAGVRYVHFSELQKMVLDHDPQLVPHDPEYELLFLSLSRCAGF